MHSPMRVRRFAAASLAAGLVAALGPQAGQAATWRPVGPSIGWPTDLAEDPAQPGRFLAPVVGRGLLVSVDGGPWHAEATGLEGQPVRAIAFAPSDPSILYAATGGSPFTSGRGVFRSDDGGRTWLARNSGMERFTVSSLAIDRVDPEVVYAALNEPFIQVMRTVDGGVTWTDFSEGLPRRGMSSLLLLPGNPAVLLAIQAPTTLRSARSLLRRELTAGSEWKSIELAIAIAYDRARSRLWVARERSILLFSDDAGATFTQAPFSPRQFIASALAVEPESGRLWIADRGQVGSFSPEDGWRWSDLPLPTLPTEILLDGRGNVRVATDGAGFFVSADGGTTWSADPAPLAAGVVQQLAFAPPRSRMLLATRGGLFRSDDGGRTWQHQWDLVPDWFIHGFASTPSRPERIFLASADHSFWESEDGGTSWRQTWEVSNPLSGGSLQISSDGELLYMITNVVWRSSDGGRSWQQVLKPDEGGVASVRAHPTDPARVVAVLRTFSGTIGSALFVSSDGGSRWEELDLALPERHFLADVSFHPSGETLWGIVWSNVSGRGSLLLRSDDGGESWREQPLPDEAGLILELTADPHRPGRLYAGSREGLWISGDGGDTWAREPLPGVTAAVTGIVPDPDERDRLWLETQGHGLLDVRLGSPLVLGGGRFAVRASWRTVSGGEGVGVPLPLEEDTGAFWFFDDDNIELMVKVLDACSFAGHFWVFAGGLTDVEVDLAVDDLVSGARVTYSNRAGTPFRPIQDTAALPCGAATGSASVGGGVPLPPAAGAAGRPRALANPTHETELLLGDGRFVVEVKWKLPDGTAGTGRAVPLTRDTGAFWFFAGENLELLVKVIEACAFDGRFWVFAGGLTNVEVLLTVTDTATASSREYHNPASVPFQPIQDTQAFACP